MENLIVYLACFILGVSVSLIILFIMFAKIKSIIQNDFAQIANITIKNEQEDLRKQNREALEEKLLPLSKELNDFKAKVDKFNLSGVENTARIIEQLGILAQNNKCIEQEAKNLTEALTKNQNVKGAYGEDILETIFQNSGMVEGIHYLKQYSTTSENLKDDTIHKIKPDFVVNLPNNKHLIIDSKVTMTSYLEAVNDNSKIKDFKSAVKKRIGELAEKNYQNAAGIEQPDFILMYMPIDAAVCMLYEDSEIVELAYKSNIIIAGTASVIATIRLVNQLFAQYKQNENTRQIVIAGTNLYETFVQLCDELMTIQKDFDGLSQQFTTVINRFQRNNKNKPSLFSQVNKLKDYGLNSTKEIPENLLEEIINEDNNEVTIND